MKKIFDKVVRSINNAACDAKIQKGYEVWTYNIEHKKMKDSRLYRVVIYELEEETIK